MIGRVLALAIGLMSGLAGAQLPEYAQQYRQRLGGAADELRRVVTRFDDDARQQGLDREAALKRLAQNSDPVAQGQSGSVRESAERYDRFNAQLRAFEQAGPFQRLVLFAREADPGIAQETYRAFEPAWPATSEGLVMGGTAFAFGWAILIFIGRILKRLNPLSRRPLSRRKPSLPVVRLSSGR